MLPFLMWCSYYMYICALFFTDKYTFFLLVSCCIGFSDQDSLLAYTSTLEELLIRFLFIESLLPMVQEPERAQFDFQILSEIFRDRV